MFSQTGRTNGKWTAVSFTLRDKYAPVVGARRGHNSVHPYRAVHVEVAVGGDARSPFLLTKFPRKETLDDMEMKKGKKKKERMLRAPLVSDSSD